ncbi:hypothetical protein D3C76_898980 [compost metagenome]
MMIPSRIVKRGCRLQTRYIIISLSTQHIISDMVGHHVNNHLNSERMRGIYQFLKLLFGSKIVIGAIWIFYVVSMVGCVFACTVVVTVSHLRLCNRRNPNRGISHVMNIGQLVDNPLPVAALHIAEILFRGFSVTDSGAGGIIGGIPIIEAVNHNLINRVVLSNSANAGCLNLCGWKHKQVSRDGQNNGRN